MREDERLPELELPSGRAEDPGDAPMMALALLASTDPIGDNDAQSRAFLSTPGTP